MPSSPSRSRTRLDPGRLAPEELAAQLEPPLRQGSWALGRPEIAQVVQDAIRHFQGSRYDLSRMVHHAESCARGVHAVGRALALGDLALLEVIHGTSNSEGIEAARAFWEQESFDHLIRSVADCERFNRYVEENPVVAQLCTAPEQWPFSSAECLVPASRLRNDRTSARSCQQGRRDACTTNVSPQRTPNQDPSHEDHRCRIVLRRGAPEAADRALPLPLPRPVGDKSILIRLETDNGLVGWGETPQVYLGNQLTGREAVALRPLLLGLDPTAVMAVYADLNFDTVYIQSAVEMAMWDLAGKAYGLPLYRLLGGPLPEGDRAGRVHGDPDLRAGRGDRPALCRDGVLDAQDQGRARSRGRPRDGPGRPGRRRRPAPAPHRSQHGLFARGLRAACPRPRAVPAAVLRTADARRPDRRLGADPQADHHAACAERVGHDDGPGPRDPRQAGGRTSSCPTRTSAAASGRRSSWPRSRPRRTCRASSIAPTTWDPKTAAMLHLAASTPNFPLANDCTYYGLVDDIITHPFEIERGRMSVPEAPGLGIEVDLEKVRKFQVDASC